MTYKLAQVATYKVRFGFLSVWFSFT